MDKTPIILQILLGVLLIYAVLCLVLFLTQRSLIYFPQPRALSDHQDRMVLQTGEATLVLTARPVAGRKAVIYFGGNAEDVSFSLPTLADAFPEHALYLLHYRGYGGSSGKPTEAALHTDALALFDQVHADHPEITIIGRSLGAGVATRLASVRAVARLVLVTPFDSILRLAQKSFPYIPVRWLLRDKYESWRHAHRIAVPTTLIVAEHDEFIPMESALRLQQSFPEGMARTIVIPRTGHNSISASPAYIPALQAQSRALSSD